MARIHQGEAVNSDNNGPAGTVLLLTATITPPPGVPVLARVNPNERLHDYIQALQFYLPRIGRTFDGIVFAENSGSDLSQAEAAARGYNVEFLSVPGLDFPVSHGRGYGEMRLVERAMERSELIQNARIIWKCTGRYQLLNIDKLVRTRPDVDLYVHCRNYPARLAELFALAFTHTGYRRHLQGIASSLRNDVIPGVHSNEEVAFRKLLENAEGVRKRFKHVPLIKGIRGWNNSTYRTASDPRIVLRKAANLVAPWVWI